MSPISTAKIPPTTRKRKAAEAKISSTKTDKTPNKRVLASAAAPESTLPTASAAKPSEAAPPTPVTGMDSDEDFLSTVSSDDDVMQDTDNEDLSGAEGLFHPVFTTITFRLGLVVCLSSDSLKSEFQPEMTKV